MHNISLSFFIMRKVKLTDIEFFYNKAVICNVIDRVMLFFLDNYRMSNSWYKN